MEQGIVKSDLALKAEALAKNCEAFAEKLRQERDCQDVVMQIMQLAMMNKDVIHIFVDYQVHVDSLTVRVLDAETDYEANQDYIHRVDISLTRNRYENDATPLTQLLELEDKLLELIAEAKDKLEVEL
ncbi:hypothetical protein L4D09_28040 [Photobacterium makurazakiensis]|uniref:hypothetical protein n=1 Tax=Photobacterium makurazakiensis TaxID=2910234 RepID=UPI003D0DBE2E